MRTPSWPQLLAPVLGILAALAAGLPAVAASLAVGDLRLDYGPPWQRGDAEEEARAQSIVLHLSDAAGPLTVMLPQHLSRLRAPEDGFYRQLETVWRAQYGERARLDWLEAGGRRWRMLRRPSMERADVDVFHLVTVIDGRAHHLLAYAPTSAADLPQAIVRLLTGPATVQGGRDTAVPPPEPAGTGNSPSWRLYRVLRSQPGLSAMDQLMTQERRGLRGEGGITGLTLVAEEHGIKASLEGFVWVSGPNRREVRRAFLHRWDIAWAAPPPLWRDEEAAAIVVRSAAGSDRVGVEVSLRSLCAGADELRELLGAMERDQGDVSARLLAGFASCQASGFTQAEITLGAGEASRPILIQPPGIPRLRTDAQSLLLTIKPRVVDGTPGRALLGAASVHYVYVHGR